MFGFCQVKHVRPINKDGSPGFVKVSRYLAKYISKPDGWITWLDEGICERPRRQSSKHFGLSKLDMDRLIKYFTADGYSGEAKLQMISERKKHFTAFNTRFPLPRRLQELIYFDKQFVDAEHSIRYDYKKERYVPYTKLVRTPLSKLVMAYERDRSLESFIKQSWNCETEDSYGLVRETVKARILHDSADIEAREALAQKNLTRQLEGDSR